MAQCIPEEAEGSGDYAALDQLRQAVEEQVKCVNGWVAWLHIFYTSFSQVFYTLTSYFR